MDRLLQPWGLGQGGREGLSVPLVRPRGTRRVTKSSPGLSLLGIRPLVAYI